MERIRKKWWQTDCQDPRMAMVNLPHTPTAAALRHGRFVSAARFSRYLIYKKITPETTPSKSKILFMAEILVATCRADTVSNNVPFPDMLSIDRIVLSAPLLWAAAAFANEAPRRSCPKRISIFSMNTASIATTLSPRKEAWISKRPHSIWASFKRRNCGKKS